MAISFQVWSGMKKARAANAGTGVRNETAPARDAARRIEKTNGNPPRAREAGRTESQALEGGKARCALRVARCA
jgi:hypothetical protein